MKTLIFAAISAACVSAPAFAQDAAPFTGPRAEVIVGYDAVDTNTPGLGTPDGVLYGLALGYDIQAGGSVLGVDAEISDSSAKRNLGGGSLVTDRDLYVGGRVGFVLGDTALAYLKAGYTNARFEATGFGGEDADGVRVGGGVEYRLGGNLFVKGEYRYSNYEADIERHQIVGGVGIRF
jgi:outer membrane immunogenic protein